MYQWESLYEPQNRKLDAALLAMALALHTPLFMLHMKAASGHGARDLTKKLVSVEFKEQLIHPPQVILPPKVITVRDIKAAIAPHIIPPRVIPPPPKVMPPPPPPPQVKKLELAQGPDANKLKTQSLAEKLDAQKKLLESKNAFNKANNLNGPNAANPQIKLAGGASAIQAGSRLANVNAPAPTVQSRGSFQMSKNDMLSGIGNDKSGTLMAGGAAAVIVPVGKRASADASILSAQVHDKGSMKATQIAMATTGPSASGSALRGGTGGATIQNSKSFSSAPSASAKIPGLPAPGLSALPRHNTKSRSPFLITGPLADREIVNRVVPEYPEFARKKGIEASVVIQFTVTPAGDVKDNLVVLRTTGYTQMDDLAKRALREWKFVALPEDQQQDQVGTITFTFSVR